MDSVATASWLGLDGGATHTTAALVRQGRTVWRGEAGPLNHLTGEAGVERMRSSLGDIVGALPPGERSGLVGMVIAMTGATIPGKPALARSMAASLLPGVRAVITSDLAAAVWGAGAGADAMILLCGTGSGAVALVRGDIVRAGAHGSEFGDEGSAYAIAQAAVRAALKAYDGRARQTELAERLARAAGVRAVTDIPRKAYAEHWPSGQVAALAPVVGEAAGAGDEVARAVLSEAGAELGDLAAAVCERVGTEPRLSLMGGGWNLSPLLWQAAGERLRARLGHDLSAFPPLHDAAEGAVIWALAGAPGAI